jgi:hypothetical protein
MELIMFDNGLHLDTLSCNYHMVQVHDSSQFALILQLFLARKHAVQIHRKIREHVYLQLKKSKNNKTLWEETRVDVS